MKLGILLILVLFLFTNHFVLAQNAPPQCNDFVTIEGRNFMCGGQPFYPIAAEYLFDVIYTNTNPSSASDFFLSRSNSYGPCNPSCGFESLTEAGALLEIENDLRTLHKMGFNSFRTAGPAPQFEVQSNANLTCNYPPVTFVKSAAFADHLGTWAGWCMPISTDPLVASPYRDRLFYMIDQLLEKAHACSLKVFLDVGYDKLTNNSDNGSQIDHFTQYKNYLMLLAQHINSLPLYLRQTLIAYIVVEEANTYQEGQSGNKKENICTKTKEMYDLLKSIDPQHLVTIGGLDLTDLMEWDPGVMKLDFWCPHFYPEHTAYENNSDLAVKRIMSQLYWLKNNCPMPWMIGETGFGAIDDEIVGSTAALAFPVVDGELDAAHVTHGEHYQQQNFCSEMLKMVRDCNGSGFTFWNFQETWWQEHVGNARGLLRHGDGGDPANYAALKKPCVNEFENYWNYNNSGQPPPVDASGGTMPNNYYNPYNIGATVPPLYTAQYNVTEANAVTGYVYDAYTNQPVKDAFVNAWNWLYTDIQLDPVTLLNDTIYYYSGLYTFTDTNGHFKLVPYNHLQSSISNAQRITHIKISGAGAERFDEGPWGETQMNTLLPNILLDRSEFNYDGTFYNVHVSSGTKNFKGWNSLGLTNVFIDNGASSDITARNDISVNAEFRAASGCEVHIYPTEIFPNCADYSGPNFLRTVNTGAGLISAINENQIVIDFTPITHFAFLNVVPNPNCGFFTLELTTSEKTNPQIQILVFDFLGSQVFSTFLKESKYQLDLSNLAKGVYFIQVKTAFRLLNQKLIIQ